MTKAGAGTLTLTAANSHGGTILTNGILNINNTNALGSGPFTIYAGTIDNSTAAAISNANNNTMNWSSNFTFTGTRNLDLGTGAVVVTAPLTLTGNANTLTVSGPVTGGDGIFDVTKAGNGTFAYNGAIALSTPQTLTVSAGTESLNGPISGSSTMTKAGAGTLTLTAANSHGGTILTNGILNINNAGALGSGPFTIYAGTIDNSTAAAISNANNNAMNWNGSFTFTGTRDLNLGTGAVVVAGPLTLTGSASNLTVGGPVTGGNGMLDVSKAGNGTLIYNEVSTADHGADTHRLGRHRDLQRRRQRRQRDFRRDQGRRRRAGLQPVHRACGCSDTHCVRWHRDL